MDHAGASGKLTFTFPGQGSFHPRILEELFKQRSYRAQFEAADQITGRILGHKFLPIAEGDPAKREAALKDCRSLDQIGIYVSDVLTADLLMESGIRPDLLLGHSFGEIAALAVAGAYSFETGLKIVCQRCIALEGVPSAGKMAALSCGAEQAAKLIQQSGARALQVAVINHDRQTVISGDEVELRRLGDIAASQAVNQTILKSRYAFHSALLTPAVAPFRAALCSYVFQPASIPVYLGTEDRLYGTDSDLADVLSAQLIRQLDFAKIVRGIFASGYTRFVECGAGDVLTGIASKLLNGKPGFMARASAPVATGLAAGASAILAEFQRGVSSRAIDPAPELLRDVRAMLQRTEELLERLSSKNDAKKSDSKDPAAVIPQPVAQTAVDAPSAAPEPSVQQEPIAIVAMGCVLPGARNPEEYWRNILNGETGIEDPSRDDPTLVQDFLAGRNGSEISIVPDKTYTLLYGSVGNVAYEKDLLSPVFDQTHFERLSKAEKLLALATAQSLASLKTSFTGYETDRLQCILGASGDGCGEFDEALFVDSIDERLRSLEPDAELRARFSALVHQARDTSFNGTPVPKLQEVVGAVLNRAVRTYVVDAACASSLYSIHQGVKVLLEHSADVVLAGGVFAPGPANSALFAQFRGLASEACRPFDAAADGVVFGHGACMLVLKRLTDAEAQGDHIVGVIRGVGVSSDGKSPAINVPQKKGQSLAVRRAYEKSRIDPDTIQYVEAHATGTTVGDAVEFQALRESLPRSAGLASIELGSIKSLIGHTGWTAGAASVIKLCKAFEARTVPGQYNFRSTGPEIPVEDSQFTISTDSHPWPENIAGEPRRAAINGFGFGGTNAHLIIEEYKKDYHKKLCGRTRPLWPPKLAVLHWASLFPGRHELVSSEPGEEIHFLRKLLRLPSGKMLLPDVCDHMDASQYLASLVAEQMLVKISNQWPKLRSEIGVVMGVEAKTECGMRVTQRIFLDRMRRRVSELAGSGFQRDAIRILDRLSSDIKNEIPASGPYTLPGLMPNLVASRVAQLFDLNGPNLIVDMGAQSLLQSIELAAGFLGHGECKIVLAGGVNAARISPEHCEGAFMMALTTPEIAVEYGLPIECYVSVGEADGIPVSPTEIRDYRGAHGMEEIARALNNSNGKPIRLSRTHRSPLGPAKTADDASKPAQLPASKPVETVSTSKPFDSAWGATKSPYVYVQGTPIYYYTPVLVPDGGEGNPDAVSLRSSNILFLVDDLAQWAELERSGAVSGLKFQVLGPMKTEDELAAALNRLKGSFDTIIALQVPDDSPASSSFDHAYSPIADLLFAACKHNYTAIENREVRVASLCLNAFRWQHLDPQTGLSAGFLKALARELPNSVCRIVNSDETDLRTAIHQLEAEFGRSWDGSEICYRRGQRHSIALTQVERLSDDTGSKLDSRSVVVATGGGRGVTAVLAEELLNRFGCTVIALGRTDPNAAPSHIRTMDEAQLVEYEPLFYKEQIARGRKIIDLKKEFKGFQSALEVGLTVQRLSKLPGRFEYISTDLTDEKGVAQIVESVFRKYGRIDLVLHGAGIQVSKLLPKKTLREFQAVVSAKLESLRHIYRACQKHPEGRGTNYHILTSAFSYMGNDGQEDYGAANETLNRLAAVMNGASESASWTSVAWLGWAGIGMTRGLEYAALAAHRGLRGVTKEEGQKIFSELLAGQATTPVNVTLSDGELKFYKVRTVQAPVASPSPSPVQQDAIVIEREVSAENAPYVWNHLVDGIPTVPGVFLLILIAEAALELRPNLKVTAFEDSAFRRFVRIRREGATSLRLQARVISEDAGSTVVRVAVVADFVHKSGMVLQKDVEQTAVSVRLAPAVAVPATNGNGAHYRNGQNGHASLQDPYLMDGSPVKLSGPFHALENIMAGVTDRSADYRLRDELSSRSGFPEYRYLNLMMLDSLVRFGGIYRDGDQCFPICVPEACRAIRIYYDFTNPDAKTFTGSLKFIGSNPLLEADRLTVGPVEAKDPGGRTLAVVDGALSRRIGEVRIGR